MDRIRVERLRFLASIITRASPIIQEVISVDSTKISSCSSPSWWRSWSDPVDVRFALFCILAVSADTKNHRKPVSGAHSQTTKKKNWKNRFFFFISFIFSTKSKLYNISFLVNRNYFFISYIINWASKVGIYDVHDERSPTYDLGRIAMTAAAEPKLPVNGKIYCVHHYKYFWVLLLLLWLYECHHLYIQKPELLLINIYRNYCVLHLHWGNLYKYIIWVYFNEG